jgi:hypothetical protein
MGADLAAFDAAALQVAAMPRAEWMRRMPERDEDVAGWMRLRYRWRLDEFAGAVMGPLLARTGVVSPPCDLDRVIYGERPRRVGDPDRVRQLLVMTGRGVGKTTRQKIRAFHGLLFGLRRVSVTIAGTDPDAVGWIDGLRSWAEEPGPLLGAMFPELAVTGDQHRLVMSTRYGEAALFARSFTGSLRGFNHRSRRPDSIDLDDVETEDRSVTREARDATQRRLTSKVLPLVPLDGGAEVTWAQTPVDTDAVAVRAMRGHEELRGWDVVSLPVIRRWPDRADLWEACRAVYFDTAAHPTKADRYRAAREFYLQHRAEMDAGADVLDRARMGPFGVHAKLWDVGPSAFAREYLMSDKAPGAVFDPDSWGRHDVRGASVVLGDGTVIPIGSMRLHAHLDTSDGGDDGAVVVAGEYRGRVYELGSQVFEATRIAEQIAGVPPVLAPFARLGLRVLHWEPPPGAASAIERDLRAALDAAGLHGLGLVAVPSTENKNARIVNTLEPLQAGGMLSVRHDVDQRALASARAFDARRRSNRDDWLDALQRCAAGVQAPASSGYTWDDIAGAW